MILASGAVPTFFNEPTGSATHLTGVKGEALGSRNQCSVGCIERVESQTQAAPFFARFLSPSLYSSSVSPSLQLVQ